MTPRTVTVTRADLTDAADPGWDALLRPGDYYLSAAWLASFARARPVPGCRLMGVATDGTVVSGVPTYVLGAETASPYLRPDLTILRALGAMLPTTGPLADLGGCTLPTLFCGSRRVTRSAVLTTRSSDGALIEDLLCAADELAAERACRSVFLPYVDETDLSVRAVLRDAGFVELPNGFRSDLSLSGTGLDSFIQDRRSSRRNQIRRDLRRLDEAGIERSHALVAGDDIEPLSHLAAELGQKYGATRSRSQVEAAMTQMMRERGARLYACYARAGGKIRGFATFLHDGRELYAHDAGFDYAFQGRLPLYFGVLFYEAAALAADLGGSMIHYGLGSHEAKASRGCQPTALFAYVRARDDVVQAHIERAFGVNGGR